jgi:hypothetical protein
MEENLTLDSNVVDASRESVEGSQEVVTGEGEGAVVAEQQATQEPKQEKKPEQTPEENAAYKALRLKEKQEAVDKEYADLAARNGWTKLDGTPIRTKADYEAAEREYKKLHELLNSGEDEEKAALKVQLENLREQMKERETLAQRQARLERENAEFFEFFQKQHGRSITPDDLKAIPEYVYQAAARDGVPFKYAYAEYLAELRREKLAGIEAGKKTAEANATNASTATGSVTGSTADDFISYAAFEANRNNEEWVRKNYEKIMKSREKW